MFARKKRSQTGFNISKMSAANRRKRMRSNALKKVLWRQRTFAIREFAAFDENY